MAYLDCTEQLYQREALTQRNPQNQLFDFLLAVCNGRIKVSKFATALKPKHEQCRETILGSFSPRAHSSRWRQGERQEEFAHTYSTAAIWSFTSTDPKHRWTSCRILRPWNPLPLPSNRATMTLSELTSTESQSMWNLSVTNWLPGASSLQIPTHQTQTKTIDNVMHCAELWYFI